MALTKHSLHHTRPSQSVFAALSSFLPHPGLPSSFLRPFASLPPQSKQLACHRVPCGPGTTPRSIGDTETLHPGHETPPPNLGNVKVVVVAGALGGGRSYRLELGASRVEYVPVFWAREVARGVVVVEVGKVGFGMELENLCTFTFSGGAHCHESS